MTRRILRVLLSAEVMGWILVLTALRIFTLGISSSLQNMNPGQSAYFFGVSFIAALLALVLGKRNVNGMQAAAALAMLGVLGIWILGARLGSPLLDLGDAFLQVLTKLGPAIRYKVPIDTTAIPEAWQAIVQASTALSLRLQLWWMGVTTDIAVTDLLVRDMIWMLMLWLVAAWMGWFSARRNALVALLPPILLLAAVASYSERRVETLWLLVFLLLLLMGLWNYKNHTIQWERKKVDYADSVAYDLSQAVIFLTVTLGILAFITPSISWRQVRDYLRAREQNEVAEVLGVQGATVTQTAPAPKPSLPREHLLSGGFAQSEKIVMTIRTGELPPMPERVLTTAPPRHYWRSMVYDTYVGAGWVSSAALPQNIPPNTPLLPGLLDNYETLQLDVEMAQPEGKLFWSGILFSADVPFRAAWRVRPELSLFADQSTLLRADLFAASSEARAYKAQSYIPLANEEELRAAPTELPEEISQRYLGLPVSVPERVHQLAGEITKDQATAYDKAKAIESYLRTYPYDLEIPAPPEDQDVADYFLFDLKKGYCDYYATAMVVLARASGLPARFVSGYAPGSYDAPNAQYIVRELNAHSWPEIYFPEFGWIEFEPTASQPQSEHREENEALPAGPPDSSAAELLYRFRLEQTIYWLSPVAILLVILILYFTLIERWLYLRLPPAPAIEKIHRRLYRLGRPLAGERTRAETAYEFMQKLVRSVNHIKEHSRFRRFFSGAQGDIESLTELYQDTLFSHNIIQKSDARTAWTTWKRLRLRLLLARLSLSARRVLSLTTAKGSSDKQAPISIQSNPSR